MTAGRTYFVTPAGAAEPYRVRLSYAQGAWRATVERGGRAWTFDLAEGPLPGTAMAGDRPLRWSWRKAGGPAADGAGRLVLGNSAHELLVESEARHRVRNARGGGASADGARAVTAPMPGLVLAVEVEEGARVAAGDAIAIIEAMKMENEITAPVGGTIRGLAIDAGQVVEGGALLCRIEVG